VLCCPLQERYEQSKAAKPWFWEASSKPEAPKSEAPKSQAPKAEVAKAEAAKPESPRLEIVKLEATPKVEKTTVLPSFLSPAVRLRRDTSYMMQDARTSGDGGELVDLERLTAANLLSELSENDEKRKAAAKDDWETGSVTSEGGGRLESAAGAAADDPLAGLRDLLRGAPPDFTAAVINVHITSVYVALLWSDDAKRFAAAVAAANAASVGAAAAARQPILTLTIKNVGARAHLVHVGRPSRVVRERRSYLGMSIGDAALLTSRVRSSARAARGHQ
jgi:hypothetical protein